MLLGATGPFLLDDISNLAANADLSPPAWTLDTLRAAVLSNHSGPTGRPIAMATFALNAMLGGTSPFWMKLTNIAGHALNVVLVGYLAMQLTSWHNRRQETRFQRLGNFFPVAIALLWGCHPIAVTSTLYVVQRMNLLSTSFVLLALVLFVRGRTLLGTNTSRKDIAAGCYLLGSAASCIIGIFSKETAALAALYVLIIEVVLLRFRNATGGIITNYRTSVILYAVLLFSGIAVSLLLAWEPISTGYASRAFTIEERLLTETRILWHYILMSVQPSPPNLGLFLDDIAISTSLVQPLETLFAAAGLGALLAIAIGARTRLPFVSLGILLFMAGHLLESTILPLELAFEHRNYFPLLGLCMASCSLISVAFHRLDLGNGPFTMLTFGIAVTFALLTGFRALNWSDHFTFAQYAVQNHEASSRANLEIANAYAIMARKLKNARGPDAARFHIEAAVAYFERSADLNGDDVTPLLVARGQFALLHLPWPSSKHWQLEKMLRSGLPAAAVPGILDGFLDCTLSSKCSMEAKELWTLLSAYLDNAGLEGRGRAETLLIANKFARYHMGNDDMSLYYIARAARAMRDDPRYQYFLVARLIEMGRLSDAQAELEIARNLDRLGVYSRRLDKLQERLPAPSNLR